MTQIAPPALASHEATAVPPRTLLPRRSALATALVLAMAACAQDARTPAEPPDLVIPVFSNSGHRSHHGTHMTGAEVEGTPTGSRAQGQLVLHLENGGTRLRYKLLVANIVDVTQSHIHMAPPGVAGPVVVWLYPSGPPALLIPGRFNGVLAQGIITDAQVVGPLAGQGVAGLLAAIRAGNAYANVHTVQFPPGEIRGQLD